MTDLSIGFLSSYPVLNENNRLFNEVNSLIGDDLLLPFVRLAEEMRKKGLFASTVDESNVDIFDCYFLIDLPNKVTPLTERILGSAKKKYLILLECKHVMPRGYDTYFHRQFERIFTWDDDLVDGERYIKINYAHDLPIFIERNILSRRKSITMITGNKSSSDERELYSARKDIINFYNNLEGKYFYLYGINWDKRVFKNRWLKVLAKFLPSLSSFFYSPPVVYNGIVERKMPTLKKHQFSICFENRKGDNGYITEKIFDVMKAGSIPIYLGADNIETYVPSNCFIDMRQFSTMSDLHKFLFSMPDSQLLSYQNNIYKFLSTNESYVFSITCFIRTILDGFNIPGGEPCSP